LKHELLAGKEIYRPALVLKGHEIMIAFERFPKGQQPGIGRTALGRCDGGVGQRALRAERDETRRRDLWPTMSGPLSTHSCRSSSAQ
jgi:hypothetical protein